MHAYTVVTWCDTHLLWRCPSWLLGWKKSYDLLAPIALRRYSPTLNTVHVCEWGRGRYVCTCIHSVQLGFIQPEITDCVQSVLSSTSMRAQLFTAFLELISSPLQSLNALKDIAAK